MNNVLDRALQQNGAWGFWPSFRLSTTQHNGFDVDGHDGLTKGPSFKQDEQSLLLGAQYNLTGAQTAYTLKVGAFGGVGSAQAYFAPVTGVTPTSKTNADTFPVWVGCMPSGLSRIFICSGSRAAMMATLASTKSEMFRLTTRQWVS